MHIFTAIMIYLVNNCRALSSLNLQWHYCYSRTKICAWVSWLGRIPNMAMITTSKSQLLVLVYLRNYNTSLAWWTASLTCNNNFGLVALEGSTLNRIIIITIEVVKCCVATVKKCPDFISVLLYFSGPSGDQ